MCYFMVKYSEQELNEENKQVDSGEVAELMEAYKKKVEEYNKHAYSRNTTILLRGREMRDVKVCSYLTSAN